MSPSSKKVLEPKVSSIPPSASPHSAFCIHPHVSISSPATLALSHLDCGYQNSLLTCLFLPLLLPLIFSLSNSQNDFLNTSVGSCSSPAWKPIMTIHCCRINQNSLLWFKRPGTNWLPLARHSGIISCQSPEPASHLMASKPLWPPFLDSTGLFPLLVRLRISSESHGWLTLILPIPTSCHLLGDFFLASLSCHSVYFLIRTSMKLFVNRGS